MPLTPHVFRHTFATWTYECAKDPRKLQRLLRHASFDMSMAYVHEHADLTPVVNQLPAMSLARARQGRYRHPPRRLGRWVLTAGSLDDICDTDPR